MPKRGSKTSTVPVVWAILEFFRRNPNDFLSSLVTMGENWLYNYDPETKQQSMEWRHSGSPPRPKKFRVQKSARKFLASIFLDQDGILLIGYLPKDQTINAEYYSSLLVQLKDILKDQEGLVLARQCPGSQGACNPEETGLPVLPVSWSPNIFSGSGPVGLPPVLWTEKNNWKVAIFRPTRRSLLPRRPGWTENLLIFFFEWSAEVRATG